jgi:hypothetical protein
LNSTLASISSLAFRIKKLTGSQPGLIWRVRTRQKRPLAVAWSRVATLGRKKGVDTLSSAPVLLLFDDGTVLVDHRKHFLERSEAAPTLLSVSKAARLMRASTFALNSWLAAGWLTDHGTRSGRRLVNLREALLIAGLRHGASCIPDELAEVDDRPSRGVAEPDPCQGRVPAWAAALGTLPEASLATVIARFHSSGFTCFEIFQAVQRLSAGQPPRRRH